MQTYRVSLLVLDRDPIKAANYLTKDDIQLYLRKIQALLHYFYMINIEQPDTEIKRPVSTIIAYKFLKFSKLNYKWLLSFYLELQELYKIYISKTQNYYKSELLKEEWLNPDLYTGKFDFDDFDKVLFPSTMMLREIKRNNFIYKNKKRYVRDIVDLHRKIYTIKDYDETDFIFGYPEWYSRGEMILYEGVSDLDRVRVRISLDYLKGYKYYYRTSRGVWKRIKGRIPKELDYIMNSFLFAAFETKNRRKVIDSDDIVEHELSSNEDSLLDEIYLDETDMDFTRSKTVKIYDYFIYPQ